MSHLTFRTNPPHLRVLLQPDLPRKERAAFQSNSHFSATKEAPRGKHTTGYWTFSCDSKMLDSFFYRDHSHAASFNHLVIIVTTTTQVAKHELSSNFNPNHHVSINPAESSQSSTRPTYLNRISSRSERCFVFLQQGFVRVF